MKAKVKYCPQHGYPLPCDKCGLGQYELGKQAGIKEVVEWLSHKELEVITWTIPEYRKVFEDLQINTEWQSKLKEWGIK